MYWWCGSSCLGRDNVTIAVALLGLSGNCHCSRTHVSVSILVCFQPLFVFVMLFFKWSDGLDILILGVPLLVSHWKQTMSLQLWRCWLSGNCHCSHTHVSVSIFVCFRPCFRMRCCFTNGLMDLISSLAP